MSGKTKVLLALAVTAVVPLLMWALPTYIHARTVSSVSSCLNNLRQIDSAKQQWALEKHETNNSVIPTWVEIQPYLARGGAGQIPICPRGGTFTIGRLDESPTCSVHGTIDHYLGESVPSHP